MKPFRAIVLAILLTGCTQSLRGPLTLHAPPTLPSRYGVVREQLVLHGDFPLASHHRMFEELVALRGDLCKRLELPSSDEPIDVYLFETPERFKAFMRLNHPGLPQRRAFFIETDTQLKVYAQWGDRLTEDLRHEVTHCYVHAVVPNLPLWLDEGLAEYFEVARGRNGLNRDHLELLEQRLGQGGWQPDIARLERLDPSVDMSQEDYAESWAWVYLMLSTDESHRKLFCDYLRELRRDGSAQPLSTRLARLTNRPADQLSAQLRQLTATGRRSR